RGAHTAGRALEVRFQEHQVHSQDRLRGRATAQHVEPGGSARVRVLRQRQPGRRPPALEPGDRAAHRGVPPARYSALQRLRRARRPPLRGHGRGPELLMSVGRARGRTESASPGVARAGTDDRAALERRRRASHLALWGLTLIPAAVTLVHAFTGGLGFNPIESLTHRTGWWAIVLLALTLAVTPLRRLTGWHWLVRYRRQLGLATFVYASLHLGVYAFLDLGLDLSHLGEDVLKRPFITVGFTAWLVLLAL